MRATKAQLRNITKTLEKQRILETEANNMAIEAAKEYKKWVKKHKQESERSFDGECTYSYSGTTVYGVSLGSTTKSCTKTPKTTELKRVKRKPNGVIGGAIIGGITSAVVGSLIDHMTSETKGNVHEGEGSVEKEETRPQTATSAEAGKVRQ